MRFCLCIFSFLWGVIVVLRRGVVLWFLHSIRSLGERRYYLFIEGYFPLVLDP